MKNSFYSGILNGLKAVNLSGFERAQAELHLRRAASLVEMVMGTRQDTPAGGERGKVEPVIARQPEKYREAA